MALNGISTLSLKSDRQRAKLNLAQSDRQLTTLVINGQSVHNNGYRALNVINWPYLTLVNEVDEWGQPTYVKGTTTLQTEYKINSTATGRPWIT